ncbi:ABC transporter permease subunit [Listeria costaricensis]|uniref:ABC transporter permease subunit n=1 Tax=Listeria costaricensis TaxID=2026604 RepID=UPI000C07BB2F|nr:ABC transporter permease subunit [Listeria costaricensis]
MNNFTLWKKEFWTYRYLLIIVFVLFLLIQGGGLMKDGTYWQEVYDQFQSSEFLALQKDPKQKMSPEDIESALTVIGPQVGEKMNHYVLYFSKMRYSGFLLLLPIFLGYAMVSGERLMRRNHFTLGLPFSRRSIILAKLGLGIVTIVASYLISLLIGYWQFLRVVPEQYIQIDWSHATWTILSNLMVYLLLFSFSVLVGLVVGRTLPALIVLGLILVGVSYSYGAVFQLANVLFPALIQKTSFSDYFGAFIIDGNSTGASGPFILQLILFLFAIGASVLLYMRFSAEKDSRFFPFAALKWVVISFVLLIVTQSVSILIETDPSRNGLSYISGDTAFILLQIGLFSLLLIAAIVTDRVIHRLYNPKKGRVKTS